jgi:L-iditol 2-dehydrogenase
MRALSFNGVDSLAALVELPAPKPAAGEALIRIEVSAICGSELKSPPASNPGHEAAGVVVYAPDGSGFLAGQRVGVSAVTGCGTCAPCQRGVQLYCDNGTRVQNGMHADYIAAPVSALRRLPAGIAPQDAVLITGDALGVPARAYRRLPSGEGDRVLVIGLGPVGLGHVLVRAYTGAQVVAIEPSAYRRQLAKHLGADEVLEPGTDIGYEPELVIECTGVPDCIAQAFDVVATGGAVLQSGECPKVEVSPSDTFIRREVTYTGAWFYADEDYPDMVRLYEEGLPVRRMVTHEFPADEIGDAYRTFVSKESGKVLLNWNSTTTNSR